jgi:hypothetical protein
LPTAELAHIVTVELDRPERLNSEFNLTPPGNQQEPVRCLDQLADDVALALRLASLRHSYNGAKINRNDSVFCGTTACTQKGWAQWWASIFETYNVYDDNYSASVRRKGKILSRHMSKLIKNAHTLYYAR